MTLDEQPVADTLDQLEALQDQVLADLEVLEQKIDVVLRAASRLRGRAPASEVAATATKETRTPSRRRKAA